jgi:AraC-like DNA-binding protein
MLDQHCPPALPEFDILSDVLETIHLHDAEAVQSSFTAPWEIRISAGTAGFYYVSQGKCRLHLDGSESAAVLCSGDLALVMKTGGHRVRDHSDRRDAPTTHPCTPAIHPERQNPPGVAAGEGTTLVCGRFTVGPEYPNPLLAALPSIVHIRNQGGLFGTWLIDSLRLITQDGEANRPGNRNLLDHFAHLVLAHGVRAHIASLPPKSGMRLKAVVDCKLGPALGLLHSHPEIPWSVASLAREVGMSRASLAASFTHLMGVSPMKYLREYRMLKACNLLRESRASLKDIAARIGYSSEAAFSNAFKHWARTSPGRFRAASIPADSMPLTQSHPSPVSLQGAGSSDIASETKPLS